jgi:hypothetical protein
MKIATFATNTIQYMRIVFGPFFMLVTIKSHLVVACPKSDELASTCALGLMQFPCQPG